LAVPQGMSLVPKYDNLMQALDNIYDDYSCFDPVEELDVFYSEYAGKTGRLVELYRFKGYSGSGSESSSDFYFYHSDHLGSTNFMTNGSGRFYLHVSYLPFGEEYVGITPPIPVLPVSYNYRFAGKKKDIESGYSYFGARYYCPILGIWLSVDPLSDKYPHQSNYVYCSNNPLRIIDPDGRDEWDLALNGTMTKRENGRTDIDIVHAVDKNGNSVSRTFEAGSINNNAREHKGVAPDGTPYTTSTMDFSNSNTATDFFEFAAEYSNVEWGLKASTDVSFVGTSHNDGFVEMSRPEGMTLDVHSHTDNPRNQISRSDYTNAAASAAKGVNYKIYQQGKGRYDVYNASTGGFDNKELSRTMSNNLKQIGRFFNFK